MRSLHEEEAVVEKRAVPKERVRLGKETHEDERDQIKPDAAYFNASTASGPG